MLATKKLPKRLRTKVQDLIVTYATAKLHEEKNGEKQYEALISFCVEYTGPEADKIEDILKAVVANQKNRTDFIWHNAWFCSDAAGF